MRNRTTTLFAVALAASCVLLAATAWHFVSRESQRLAAQEREELETTSQRALELSQSLLLELQDEAAQQLIAMHAEGLSFQLTRWKNSNSLIDQVFLWKTPQGFALPPQGMLFGPHDALPWSDNPALSPARPFRYLRMNTSSSFPWEQGFLRENIENLEYEGKAVDPTIQWSRQKAQGETYWVCWHRVGPQDAVRGFAMPEGMALQTINALLAKQFADTFTVQLQPAGTDRRQLPQAPTTPPLALVVAPTHKQSATRTLPSIAFGLTAIGLVLALSCAAIIVRSSNQQAREATRKTNFVAQVSHEFKTPLTSISMHAELLANDALSPEKRQRFSDTILAQSDRLTQMIDNLLTLGNIERKQNAYSRAPFDLIASIRQVIEQTTPIAAKAGMRIDFKAPTDTWEITSDELAIRRILLSLIENAAKYAPSGQSISIAVSKDSSSCRISVSDQGPGIPRRDRERVFRPFVQLANELANKPPGSGLGLSIARGLARDLGGDLTLDAFQPSGASFTLQIPSS